MLVSFVVYSVLVLTLIGQASRLYDFVVEVLQSLEDRTY